MDVETARADLEAWLILLRAPGLGPVSLRELLAAHGGIRAALAAARRGAHPRACEAMCRDWLRAPDLARIADDLAWLAEPFSLSRTASSTAISQKGFMLCFSPAVSTPVPSALTRTLTLASTTSLTATSIFIGDIS